MQTVKEFLGELGGTVAVATALDLPISTVSGWNISNSIPSWRRPALAELAESKGSKLPDKFRVPSAGEAA